jgi:hypothetical protein
MRRDKRRGMKHLTWIILWATASGVSLSLCAAGHPLFGILCAGSALGIGLLARRKKPRVIASSANVPPT